MPKPIDHEMDAACALLLDDEGMSVRDASAVLGIAHSNVAARAKRFAAAEHPRHVRRPLTMWARGFVAGRRSALDERVQAAPESWEDRLSRLSHDPENWQTVHVMPYDSATSSVSKLRLSRHAIERGGSWQFRVERAQRPHTLPMAEAENEPRMGKVMALWRGTPCTNCGAVTLDEKACSLCGCDKDETPSGDDS